MENISKELLEKLVRQIIEEKLALEQVIMIQLTL